MSDRAANQEWGATMSITETGRSAVCGRDRRFAGFSLMCFASLGLTLACSQASRLSMPERQAVPPIAFVTVGPVLHIKLTDAVIPADVWLRMEALYGGDQTRIAGAVSKSDYVVWEQSVVASSAGAPVVCHWQSRSRIPACSGSDASSGALATEVWSYSVAPRLNPNGTFTIGVGATRNSPADRASPPENYRFDTDITLRDGDARILRASHASPDAPVRVSLIAAGTESVWRKPPHSPPCGASSALFANAR
jgi:hypothetical protein